eukprot:UN33743
MDSFAVNALLKAEEVGVDVLEGSRVDDVQKARGGGHTVNGLNEKENEVTEFKRSIWVQDDSSKCRNAFRTLVKMLKEFIAQLKGDKNSANYQQADVIASHLYYWIKNPKSKFYDPLLHKLVHKMMVKVFFRLLQKLRTMSAEIIFASFNKIIIDTGKFTLKNATAFVQNTIETVTADAGSFKWIVMTPRHIFKIFLFLDEYNWGGYIQMPKDDVQDMAIFDANQNFKIVKQSIWNIGDYLPEKIETQFDDFVEKYLDNCYHKQIEISERISKNKELTQEYAIAETNKEFIEYRKIMIAQTLSHELFEMVKLMHEYYPSDSIALKSGKSTSIFPDRPGSHLCLYHPTLEFIKYYCRFLSLDVECEESIRGLRTSLMRLIDVRAMSAPAQFINPSLTYILSDVQCIHCNHVRDIDVCREPLTEANKFQCDKCEEVYENEIIESMLLEIVIRKNTSFQVQDLICVTCKSPKSDLLGEFCPCSGGEYECKESLEAFLKSMV